MKQLFQISAAESTSDADRGHETARIFATGMWHTSVIVSVSFHALVFTQNTLLLVGLLLTLVGKKAC